MAGNSKRRGAIRKPGTKKGPTVGSGGVRRRGLEGRGATPAAKDRVNHPAAKRAAKAARKQQGRQRKTDDVELVLGRNPVVECLRAGRFAVANQLPAYQPLGSYCWLGDSIVEGLKWALNHPDEAQHRTLEGQAFVEATYSPDAVAGAWEKVLAHLEDRRT